jgi:DNA-binding GntR family transcriptional regulator/cytochrome c553
MNQKPPPPPPARNLAAEVVACLRNEIISGQLAPGVALAEPVLATRFGLSRVPVREALIELEREGLIQFESTGRTRVRTLARKDLIEIIEARSILEIAAARKLTLEWTKRDTAWVKANIAAQAKASTLAELSHLDVEMHEYLMRRTGNERLLRLWQSIRWQFQMCLARTHRLQEKLADKPHQITINAHRRLLKALESGDPEVAAATMKVHIEGALKWEIQEPGSTTASVQSTDQPSVKSPRVRSVFKAAAIAFLLQLCGASFTSAAEVNDGTAFFESKIRPILVEHCYDCHSGDKTKGGLALDSKAGWQKGGENGPAIVPGKPEESLLVKAVQYEDPDLAMPPKKKGGKLSDENIKLLNEWIKMGAHDPREAVAKIGGMKADEAKSWWAFQPLPKHDAPANITAAAAQIDAFLNTRLQSEGLQPSPPADKRTLLRRATYDLTGLPPSPEEVDAFLADASPDAFSKIVERLLSSPQYGVKWGRHWLDVVRYADTAGENTDRPLMHAWRYRNWVFDAFNKDLPYNEFVRLQLAGDLERANGPREQLNEGIVATGYLAIARRFGHEISKDVHLMYDDVIDNLGRSFLGLTIACARCHDHKYDPISAADYYSLYGILQSTQFSYPGCEASGKPRDMVPLIAKSEADALMKPWLQKRAQEDALRTKLANAGRTLKTSFTEQTVLLAASPIAEGASVGFEESRKAPLDQIAVRKGEVILLTVSPNKSHGADSTLVEWTIRNSGAPEQVWSASDLVSTLTESNPHAGAHDAAWCFLSVGKDGPVYLHEKHTSVNGHSDIQKWSIGDTPSVFVNSSDQQLMVWTTLPARSFLVHPGPNQPVAVAWVSPIDGMISIQGRVADAHPANSDGVAFELKHLRTPSTGTALLEIGRHLQIPEAGAPPSIPWAYAVAEDKPLDAHILIRGEPEKPGEKVPRRWFGIFGGQPITKPAESGRRELGQWISGHPVSARVIANRVWQWHFGNGIVRSSSDFGSRGEKPSHPELLDFLASEFVAHGYSIKTLHRVIMGSSAYQRSSDITESLHQKDPENRLLGRFARRRLDVEEIRDSLLTASGQLDLNPGEAHPFPPEDKWKFTQHNPFNAVYEHSKRSAFLMTQRQRRHPFLGLFDGADTNASTPQRQTTTVPSQALFFLNDRFFHDQAAAFASTLTPLPDDPSRIKRAFQSLFQREPSAAEIQKATSFLASYGSTPTEAWKAYSRVLLAGNEFMHID